MKTFLDNYRYDIIHINNGSPITLYIVGKAAKKAVGDNSKIILHAHSARAIHEYRFPLAAYFTKESLGNIGDIFLACSDLAAMRVFPKVIYRNGIYHRIPNAIPLDKFSYDEERRIYFRKKLGVEDSFVVGHVGRFSTEKNHSFLIDVFTRILNHNCSARLLLIGSGKLIDDIKAKVRVLGIEDAVIFAGIIEHDEISDYYNAMDVFVLPSIYEGFPVTAVEAQATGLPVIASDSVTEEIDLVGLCTFVSLSDAVEVWDEAISNVCNDDRRSFQEQLHNVGYDISCVATFLSDLYFGEV